MAINKSQLASASNNSSVRSIRRDLVVFQFRCKEGTREVIADGLGRMMEGTRDSLALREIVELHQSLFNKGVIVPRVYPDQGAKLATDKPRNSRAIIRCAEDDGRLRPGIRFALLEHFEEIGLTESNLGRHTPPHVFGILADLLPQDSFRSIDTKTIVRLVPSAEAWGEFVITQEIKLGTMAGGIRSVLETLARAGVPLSFGEIDLPSTHMDSIGGCISVLPDGVVQHAIGTYKMEGHNEIYSKSLMVRLPGSGHPDSSLGMLHPSILNHPAFR